MDASHSIAGSRQVAAVRAAGGHRVVVDEIVAKLHDEEVLVDCGLGGPYFLPPALKGPGKLDESAEADHLAGIAIHTIRHISWGGECECLLPPECLAGLIVQEDEPNIQQLKVHLVKLANAVYVFEELAVGDNRAKAKLAIQILRKAAFPYIQVVKQILIMVRLLQPEGSEDDDLGARFC